MVRSAAGFLVFLAPLMLSSVGCSAADDSADDVSESGDAIGSGALTRSDLPAGRFRTRVDELTQKWLGSKLLSGEARIEAGRFRGTLSETTLSEFMTETANEKLRRSNHTLRWSTFNSRLMTNVTIREAAASVAIEGLGMTPNWYNVDPVERDIRELIAFIGREPEIDAFVFKGGMEGADFDHEAVSFRLFVNRETKQFVAFYARQDTPER